MISVNIHQAKTHLSDYLARVEAGETIQLCRRNAPIAEIRPIPKAAAAAPVSARPIGLAKGLFTLPPNFFDALPDDIVAAFESGGA